MIIIIITIIPVTFICDVVDAIIITTTTCCLFVLLLLSLLSILWLSLLLFLYLPLLSLLLPLLLGEGISLTWRTRKANRRQVTERQGNAQGLQKEKHESDGMERSQGVRLWAHINGLLSPWGLLEWQSTLRLLYHAGWGCGGDVLFEIHWGSYPLAAVLCVVPLPMVLAKRAAGYEWSRRRSKTNRLLFVDDLKLFWETP